jgi:hypothetical protein
MTPDLGTIAQRRHLVTIFLRVGVLVWVCYSLTLSIDMLAGNIDGFAMGGVMAVIFSLAIPLACRCALAGAVLLMERPLVRWLVPVSGMGEHACPKCGYSLKNLKSPVCPECGMDLR